MKAHQLGNIGQGIFNILRRYIDDREMRHNITEKVMDLIVLIMDEEKAKEFLDGYNNKHNTNGSNGSMDDTPESEIRAEAERLV